MKNKVKQLAAGIFLAILVIIANAYANGSELNAIKMEIFEEPAHLESWMTNDEIWITESFNNALVVKEEEPVLEIESWMTQENFWDLNYLIVTETETGLELENWMTSERKWN